MLGRLEGGESQEWPATQDCGFWPRAAKTHFCISLWQRASPAESGGFCGVRTAHTWQVAGRGYSPFDFPLVQRDEPSIADEAMFRALAALWRRDTMNISSTSRMALHPAYQRIIGMGSVAVPLILRELQERPDWWFWALRAITGVDPVPSGCRGSLHSAAAAWLEWGRGHGYLAS